jgi:hypothetical protein
VHGSPAGHTTPQFPQLFWSICRFVHPSLEQYVYPALQPGLASTPTGQQAPFPHGSVLGPHVTPPPHPLPLQVLPGGQQVFSQQTPSLGQQAPPPLPRQHRPCPLQSLSCPHGPLETEPSFPGGVPPPLHSSPLHPFGQQVVPPQQEEPAVQHAPPQQRLSPHSELWQVALPPLLLPLPPVVFPPSSAMNALGGAASAPWPEAVYVHAAPFAVSAPIDPRTSKTPKVGVRMTALSPIHHAKPTRAGAIDFFRSGGSCAAGAFAIFEASATICVAAAARAPFC